MGRVLVAFEEKGKSTMALYRLVSRFAFVALPAAIVCVGAAPAASAAATSGRDCHAAFQSAKTSGTLQGQNYLAFKAAHCASGTVAGATPSVAAPAVPATPAAPSVPSAPAVTKPAVPSAPTSASVKPSATALPTGSVQTGGKAVFPSAISPEFAKLSAGKARLKTCAAQYQANKANGGNAGLTWISNGGGYWSACNAHLKG
ncbi:hypothetical protein [Neokomagataea thailandica]|nr:hypothetical protein [Neokomagataea thailandica]